MKRLLGILMFSVSFLLFINLASAGPVDFNTFTADGGAEISGDVLIFDEYYSVADDYMYIYDDNFYVSAPNLTFDYYFEVAAGNADYLLVDINYDNISAPDFEVGGDNSNGNDLLIFEGSYSIDVSAYMWSEISLTFGLEYVDDYADSYGEISNVSVPEPSTMLLLSSSLVGLAGMGRRKFLKKS